MAEEQQTEEVVDDFFEDEEWRTDDIILAAYLKMHVELIDTLWDGGKCFWIFDDTDELADLVSEYIGGRAEGNLKEYNAIIASLKRRMYEEEREVLGHSRY